jgi:hypothetical protein
LANSSVECKWSFAEAAAAVNLLFAVEPIEPKHVHGTHLVQARIMEKQHKY